MAKLMTIRGAVNHFQEKLGNKQISRVLDVSADQVYKYGSGYTKTCSDKVVDAFYDNFRIDGEPVLLDYFSSESEYLELRELRKNFK